MSRKHLRFTRSLPARRISWRAPTYLANDTEKLKGDSAEDLDAEPAHRYHQSRVDQLQPASQPTPYRDYSVHEINNAPVPIPDTIGLPPPSTNATSSHSHATPTFVPLPYMKTANITEIEEAAARSSSVVRLTLTQTAQTAAVTTAGMDHNSQMNNPHPFSTPAIVALAVGGGLTLLVVAILVKVIKRSQRRRTRTSSLLVLHDRIFSDDRAESESSPIFGGKEYSSPSFQGHDANGNTGPWKWTQYKSRIASPVPAVTVTRLSSQDQLTSNQANQQDKLGGIDNATDAPGQCAYGLNSANPVTVQSRAVSRLNMVSTSLCSTLSPGEHLQVGSETSPAIDGSTHGEQVAAQNYEETTASIEEATRLGRLQNLAYGGMETRSPSANTVSGGRVHTSSYYTPGSYPGTSAAAANYGKHDLSQERHGSGRGLASASPQPAPCPDDLMRVMGEAKKMTVARRGLRKPIPKASLQCDNEHRSPTYSIYVLYEGEGINVSSHGSF